MMKKKKILNKAIFFLLVVALSYYVILPPIHYQSSLFWAYALTLAFFALGLFVGLFEKKQREVSFGKTSKTLWYYMPKKKAFKGFFFLGVFALALIAVGYVSSAEVFHAGRYADLIEKKEGNFEQEVKEVPWNKILTVDRDTAVRLGNRKMGEVVDLVSQFVVSEDYAQINYKGTPVRISPLQYASVIKWVTNHSEGIPYYMKVNMINGETELVKLTEAIKYSKSEYFNRYIYRHLRFQYPFKMFTASDMEIDEDGRPFWVTPVYSKEIGLFGGLDVQEVILTDACTGKSELYNIKDVPTWIDRAHNTDLIMEQINWNGKYQNGFINAHVGQKGVLKATAGYNYLALGDDVYVYTGITSVSSDASNIGFVLVNMRTKECVFYSVPSAEEFSAMGSAEGAVQEKNYRATFPLLYNINGRPTYFLSLKDQAGLIKMYAFIDAENYQRVVTGLTVKEAFKAFSADNGSTSVDDNTDAPTEVISGKISAKETVLIGGDTYYYFMLENQPTVYIAPYSLGEFVPFLKAGDKVDLTVKQSDNTSKRVLELEKK